MKLCQEENGGESEEQQNRVQKNETGNAQPADVLKERESSIFYTVDQIKVD